MKVQKVSNQNFNGRIIFINNKNIAGKTEELSKNLATLLSKNYPEIETWIEKKPYELFVSRPKNISEFYQVDANVKFENVLGEDSTVKGISSMVYEGRLDRFPTAAYEAMTSFEKAPAYEELVKPEGFFEGLWRTIRGIKIR